MPSTSYESRPGRRDTADPGAKPHRVDAAVTKTALRAFAARYRGPAVVDAAWRATVDLIDGASGDGDFARSLGRHLAFLGGMSDLTADGWLRRFREMTGRLENRARIDRIVAAHPRIERETIVAPVVVVGLPRTATTLTHRVLSQSAPHRGPLLWEYCRTDLELPAAKRESVVAATAELLGATLDRAPGFEDIHRIRADLPDECDWLIPNTYTALCFAPVPEYRDWIASRDMTEDYRYLKRALQVLQHGRPPRRWMLKSPWHVANLDVIAEVFPDAVFVWTHREPAEAVGSFCSLAESLAKAHRTEVRPDETGGFWLRLLAHTMARGRAARERLPNATFVDVPYRRLIADPERCFADLYAQIGAVWTDEDAVNLRRRLARRTPRGAHRYRLDRYGLAVGDVKREFDKYAATVGDLG